MTTSEFSNMFDALLNSYATQATFGDQASRQEIVLDEYEKSVLLTQAQDIIVKQYFERTSANLGFDESERRQIDFSNLITVGSVPHNATNPSPSTTFAEGSWLFSLPNMTITGGGNNKVLFILNERLVISKTTTDPIAGTSTTDKKIYVVVPINYHEYDRQMSKPFAQPLKKQAWRLLQDDANSSTYESPIVEIVPTEVAHDLVTKSNYTPTYKIRFVRRPKPIILVPLGDSGLSIDEENEVSECELNPILHMDILNKAVELAYTTRGGRTVSKGSKE